VEFPAAVASVHIANSLATLADLNETEEAEMVAIAHSTWQAAVLGQDVIAVVVPAARAAVADVRALFNLSF
jgi:hypothetical protein